MLKLRSSSYWPGGMCSKLRFSCISATQSYLNSFLFSGDKILYSSWNMHIYYDLIIFNSEPGHLLLRILR